MNDDKYCLTGTCVVIYKFNLYRNLTRFGVAMTVSTEINF